MSTNTAIEWTDVTWNPVRGCSLVSAGCANCYAMKQAHRFSGEGKPYEGLTEIGPQGARWNGKIRLVPEALDDPLHWREPRRVFVNSMSDLFHEDVPLRFILQVFEIMRRSPRHTYQILTKRAERMKELITRYPEFLNNGQWPIYNVWLGVSVEDQMTADARIPILLQTPAAVRFISAEPLLGPVDLARYLRPAEETRSLDWVIIGGESGPDARRCDIDWIRQLKNQCQAAKVAVFLKQLGSKAQEDGCEPGHVWTGSNPSTLHRLNDKKGGHMAEWPDDLRIRQLPNEGSPS